MSADVTTMTDTGEVLMKAGQVFSFITAYKPNTLAEKQSQTGYEVVLIPFATTAMKPSLSAGGLFYGCSTAAAAPEIAALFQRAYPEKCIADASLLDTFARLPTCDFIEKKAAASGAPAYNYVFSFEFPVGSGRVAWHCSDIPFAFRNTDKVAVCNKPGVSDRLEDQVSSAWVRFARTGDPNGPGLPHWPACKPGSIQTMILDETCRAAENHDQALYAAVMQAVRARPGTGKKPVVHR